jgi:hypothetical protein
VCGSQFFPSTRYLDYAVRVEEYTLTKSANLVSARAEGLVVQLLIMQVPRLVASESMGVPTYSYHAPSQPLSLPRPGDHVGRAVHLFHSIYSASD